jgi:hypothetical protein
MSGQAAASDARDRQQGGHRGLVGTREGGDGAEVLVGEMATTPKPHTEKTLFCSG